MTADNTWTNTLGTWGITSNKGYFVTASGAGTVRGKARLEADLATDDHSNTVTINNGGGAFVNRGLGPTVRGNASDLASYGVTLDNSQTLNLWKFNAAGAETLITSTGFSHTISTNQTIKLEVIGTTINVYMNGSGTPTISTTDSSVTTGTRVGVIAHTNTGTTRVVDSLTATDEAAAPTGNRRRRMLLLGVGS